MKGAMEAAKPLVIDEDEIMVVSSNDVVDDSLWLMVNSSLKEQKKSNGYYAVGFVQKNYR